MKLKDNPFYLPPAAPCGVTTTYILPFRGSAVVGGNFFGDVCVWGWYKPNAPWPGGVQEMNVFAGILVNPRLPVVGYGFYDSFGRIGFKDNLAANIQPGGVDCLHGKYTIGCLTTGAQTELAATLCICDGPATVKFGG